MARVARQVHDALLVEARGVFAALRAEPVSAGDWERCEAQWRALLAVAEQGLRVSRLARHDATTFTVPAHKQGLRDLAETLGLSVAPFEGYTHLKERVLDELRMRAEAGR